MRALIGNAAGSAAVGARIVLIVLINALVDALRGWMDPRLRET